MNIDTLAKVSEIENHGTFDYAIPYDWMMVDPENRRQNVWLYPKKGKSIFGRPLAWKTMARMGIKKLIRKSLDHQTISDLLECWSIAYPNKELSTHIISMLDDYLKSMSTDHMALIREHWGINYLLEQKGIPNRFANPNEQAIAA